MCARARPPACLPASSPFEDDRAREGKRARCSIFEHKSLTRRLVSCLCVASLIYTGHALINRSIDRPTDRGRKQTCALGIAGPRRESWMLPINSSTSGRRHADGWVMRMSTGRLTIHGGDRRKQRRRQWRRETRQRWMDGWVDATCALRLEVCVARWCIGQQAYVELGWIACGLFESGQSHARSSLAIPGTERNGTGETGKQVAARSLSGD